MPASGNRHVQVLQRIGLSFGGVGVGVRAALSTLKKVRAPAMERREGPPLKSGSSNDMLRETTERIGDNIMGKRIFEQGERAWPEEAPFHTPVYVLTHEKREPWVRPGGTTFYFVNDGVKSTRGQARESAGGRDIRIAGGADVIQQYLNMGVIDELEIAQAPVLFSGGRRLFENLHESVSHASGSCYRATICYHRRTLPAHVRHEQNCILLGVLRRINSTARAYYLETRRSIVRLLPSS